GFWPMAFDVGRYSVALVAAVAVGNLVGRFPLEQIRPIDLLNVLLIVVVWYLVFRLTTATGIWLHNGGEWIRLLLRGQPAEALAATALLSLALIVAVVQNDEELVGLVVVPIVAVSQMSHLYAQFQWRSMRDPLTGLPNRLGLERLTDEPIRQLREH